MANGALLIVIALLVLFVVVTGRGQCIGGAFACLASPGGTSTSTGATSNTLSVPGIGSNTASATYTSYPVGPTVIQPLLTGQGILA